MPDPMVTRQERQTGLSARDLALANARRGQIQPKDQLTELRAIRMLLERTFKPPTIQKLGINTSRFVALPVIPNPGLLILDHDDDRDQIILLNPTAGQIGVFKWDDGNFPDNNTNIGGILLPNVPLAIGIQGAPSNRLFAASAIGNSIDLLVSVIRIDRFPRSTR